MCAVYVHIYHSQQRGVIISIQQLFTFQPWWDKYL